MYDFRALFSSAGVCVGHSCGAAVYLVTNITRACPVASLSAGMLRPTRCVIFRCVLLAVLFPRVLCSSVTGGDAFTLSCFVACS